MEEETDQVSTKRNYSVQAEKHSTKNKTCFINTQSDVHCTDSRTIEEPTDSPA